MSDVYKLLTLPDFIVVAIYLVVVILIGYWASFGKKRGDSEHLFLAGNNLKWQSIGFTMWGTNVGPSMLIASASIGYTSGVVAGNFGWYAFIFIFLLATYFAPRYLGARVQTLPEFMGRRFGSSTRNILAWYSILTILISWLALTLYAGGILIGQVLGLPLWLSAFLLLAISIFFTMAGGLKTIAYTNVFQMLLLIIVSLLLVVFGINKAGGVSTIISSTPSHYWNLFRPLTDSEYPWHAIILGYPVMGIWFWCTDQSMVQSVLGAKSLEQGQKGANFTGWLKILDVALFIFPGIICFVLFPNLSNPDEAYMTMVTNLFPSGMVGLVIAVLIAALVSTIDSALNSLSTVFTMDIYIEKSKKELSSKQIIAIGRWVTLVGAIISVAITLAINKISGLNLFDIFQAVLSFLAPPMAVVFLYGTLGSWMTKKAANFTLTFGTVISIGVGMLYLWVFPVEKYDFWPHFLLLSFYLFVLLSIFAVVISFILKDMDEKSKFVSEKSLAPYFASINQKWLWISLFAVMIFLYILFNGH